MKIALIDVDGHNFPNLPLMKLSTWHKKHGDNVDWYEPLTAWYEPPDIVYMSKVFTFTPDYPHPINARKIIKGGTGYFYPNGGNPLNEELTEKARCLQARYNKGVSNHKAETSGVAIPVLTPDRTEKRQNGRRFKENGEPMFTLTSQDRHGVATSINPIGGVYTGVSPEFYRGVYEGCFRCLKASTHDSGVALKLQNIPVSREYVLTRPGMFMKISDELTIYAVWYEKYQCYIAIRKLTPKECFRLQGWTDEYFEKAAFVNSDSQLYKQAGNGVTVNVIEAIAKQLKFA